MVFFIVEKSTDLIMKMQCVHKQSVILWMRFLNGIVEHCVIDTKHWGKIVCKLKPRLLLLSRQAECDNYLLINRIKTNHQFNQVKLNGQLQLFMLIKSKTIEI